jgi:DNA-binding MarR family transcriptional regulator
MASERTESNIAVAILLRRVQLRKQLACEAALAAIELTLPQWGILHAAAAHRDQSTHALALRTGQSDQSAGAVVVGLEKRALLERFSAGGRAILHRLTESGSGLVARADRIVDQVMQEELGQLTDDDLNTLWRLLDRIVEPADLNQHEN